MNSKAVRQRFLDFFAQNGHAVVASSSLIPAEDPTLLFANAGMNQFKDCFLGLETRSYNRATSSQKCVRAGGKHNDLEQVGFTARHLTFFEMLGNFSFGDYFKKEAITFAWELLTKVYQLDPERLWPTVYYKDDESFNLWHEITGLPHDRIGRLGDADNFWSMGDVGPCGPCTEIYFDKQHGGCGSPECRPGCECDRFMEIWNLVFMQFDRQPNGELKPLSQTGVDTGMGLERICSVLQGVDNVFDIDSFAPLRATIEQYAHKTFATCDTRTQGAFNVICDHTRSSALLIADGCSPANDGRGYVLRKIIRRAILFAQKLSDNNELLLHCARTFIKTQSDIFPELAVNKELILSVLAQEISRFTHNLKSGQVILQKYLEELRSNNTTQLSGQQVFKLYDTYGFPVELTKVIVQEHQVTLDIAGFEQEMAAQQEQSRHKKHAPDDAAINFPETFSTNFVGYHTTSCEARILWEHRTENSAWIITDASPFYVESGGQVNDEGIVTINEYRYQVADLKKVGQRFFPAIAIKLIPLERMGTLAAGDIAQCEVDISARAATVRNHTATHMLHAALHELLGKQAKQAGSVVNKEYLRFDYTHHEALSSELIQQIENRINRKIWENIPTTIYNTTLADAQEKGVIAFFGEKYNPEDVRVVQIPGFSIELCGGTHAASTGTIGCFKIISDVALATGTRRIVAVTGSAALALYQQCYTDLKALSEQFKVKIEQVVDATQRLQEQLHAAQLETRACKKQLMGHVAEQLQHSIDTTHQIPSLITLINDATPDDLRTIGQTLELKTAGFFFLATNNKEKGCSQFMIITSKSFQERIDHRELLTFCKTHQLRGGGKPGLIQGSGPILTEDFLKTIRSLLS